MLVESSKDILYKRCCSLAAIAAGACVGVGVVVTTHGRPAAAAAPAAHRAAHVTKPVIVAAAKPAPANKPKPAVIAKHQPHAPHRPRVTVSLYEHTTSPVILRRQGCSAAKRNVGGIVILDFGQPAYNGHSYGTNLFSGRFAANWKITRGMGAYAHGYVYCLPRHSTARIALARGTSNYRPQVPSAYKAGRKWARETRKLARVLHRRGYEKHVSSAAASDVEPAWDRAFHKTRDFFRGYRDGKPGNLLYNFGSLDGGVGGIWNLRQVFFVTGGVKYARAIPEIYNRAMAREWAQLARFARRTYHKPIRFAGVMTQYRAGTGWMEAHEAHRALVRALASTADVPPTLTNIRAAD
jgi:hypothetical protein